MRRLAVLVVFGLGAAWGQMAPEVVLLARIKAHMRQVLQKLPNYTCLETIERSTRRASSKKFELVDAIHLEVAFVDGKELFSWPGEREFKERDLRELAPRGAIGNGSFALHPRSVFLSGDPTFTYKGHEVLEGRDTIRFDFQVPQFRSGYRLKVNELEGVAGYQGTFWADPEKLDLIRLDVHASEIPPYLPLKAAGDSMRYARVQIGETSYLLPERSEMNMEDVYGNRSRNGISFSRCRQYAGESVLSFADVPEDPGAPVAAPAPPPPPIVVPAGLTMELELLTPVTFPGMAVGDPIEGRVKRDIKRKGALVIPRGATVKGNIVVLGMERTPRGDPFFAVAFQWREIAFEGRTGVIDLQLQDGGALGTGQSMSVRDVYVRPRPQAQGVTPHRNVFYVRRSTLALPRGLPLFWSTVDPSSHGVESQ